MFVSAVFLETGKVEHCTDEGKNDVPHSVNKELTAKLVNFRQKGEMPLCEEVLTSNRILVRWKVESLLVPVTPVSQSEITLQLS